MLKELKIIHQRSLKTFIYPMEQRKHGESTQWFEEETKGAKRTVGRTEDDRTTDSSHCAVFRSSVSFEGKIFS